MNNRKPRLSEEQCRQGGLETQKVLRERGEHPLARYNFWAHATRAQRVHHSQARSARARAERACLAIRKSQGECS